MVRKNSNDNHKTENFWLKSLLVLFLCVAAGFAGAKLQAFKSKPVNNKDLKQNLTDNTALIKLSDEIGQLKGRLLAMEAIRNSLSKSAGIDHKLTEIAIESGPQDKARTAEPLSHNGLSLDSLSYELEGLRNKISLEEDLSLFMGLSLSDQSGFHASLPTFAPVEYPALSSSFGWRKNPVSGKHTMHEGLDFAAPWGSPIIASSGGIVTHAGPLGAYGNMVELDHGNGLVTRYAHVSKVLVKTGDLVNQGTEIAKVGSTGRSTGAHLHFEVRVADYPLDPTLFIDKNNTYNRVLAKNDPPISANKS